MLYVNMHVCMYCVGKDIQLLYYQRSFYYKNMGWRTSDDSSSSSSSAEGPAGTYFIAAIHADIQLELCVWGIPTYSHRQE